MQIQTQNIINFSVITFTDFNQYFFTKVISAVFMVSMNELVSEITYRLEAKVFLLKLYNKLIINCSVINFLNFVTGN